MPAKYDRCVRKVRASGRAVNPYAVCTAAGLRRRYGHARIRGVSKIGRNLYRKGKYVYEILGTPPRLSLHVPQLGISTASRFRSRKEAHEEAKRLIEGS